MNKRILALSTSLVLGVSTLLNAGVAMAATTNETTKNFEFKKPENEVIGKITSIDATNVVIQVATRKEMQKPAEGQNMIPPEKKDNNSTNQMEKPNMDDFYTLTGETKTINIASADLGKSIDFTNFKPEENKGEDQKQKMEDAFKNAKAKTYQDYKVGDYITIECTDSTYKTAKTVSDGNMMRGGFRGFGGKDFKKKDENKQ